MYKSHTYQLEQLVHCLYHGLSDLTIWPFLISWYDSLFLAPTFFFHSADPKAACQPFFFCCSVGAKVHTSVPLFCTKLLGTYQNLVQVIGARCLCSNSTTLEQFVSFDRSSISAKTSTFSSNFSCSVSTCPYTIAFLVLTHISTNHHFSDNSFYICQW